MPQTEDKKFSDHITLLDINGMNGRMLKMPSPPDKKREIFLVYGHHSSLERMQGLAELLNDYGGVTMADLPGFGGMDSLYKIGQQPDLDTMADYLASVIKLRYRNRRFTIIALSYGFVVVTRMLQRYPEMAKKVDVLVSAVGFTHKDDFRFTKTRHAMYVAGSRFFSRKWPAVFFRNVALHPLVIKTIYTRTHNAKHKFKHLSPAERKRAINFEVHLWRANDLRTHMATAASFLTVDNCQKQIDLPIYHLSVANDNYFDNEVVAQHMQVIFNDYHEIPMHLPAHSASIVATKKESEPLVPPALRDILRRDP